MEQVHYTHILVVPGVIHGVGTLPPHPGYPWCITQSRYTTPTSGLSLVHPQSRYYHTIPDELQKVHSTDGRYYPTSWYCWCTYRELILPHLLVVPSVLLHLLAVPGVLQRVGTTPPTGCPKCTTSSPGCPRCTTESWYYPTSWFSPVYYFISWLSQLNYREQVLPHLMVVPVVLERVGTTHHGQMDGQMDEWSVDFHVFLYIY